MAPQQKRAAALRSALSCLASRCICSANAPRPSPESIGNGAVERTGGEARNEVRQALPDEAPRGTREPTRTSSDGLRIHDRDDIRVLCRSAVSYNISEQAVSVGRCEDTVPDCRTARECEVYHDHPGRAKASKMRGVSRPDRARSNRDRKSVV